MRKFHNPYSKSLQLIHELDLHKTRYPEVRRATKIAQELATELHALWDADEPNET